VFRLKEIHEHGLQNEKKVVENPGGSFSPLSAIWRNRRHAPPDCFRQCQ
jgi:hypothetical protein